MKQQYQYMQGSKNSRPGGWIQGVSADIFYISLIFHGSRGGPSILPVVRMVSNFLQIRPTFCPDLSGVQNVWHLKVYDKLELNRCFLTLCYICT